VSHNSKRPPLLDALPTPEAIRRRLSEILIEADVLRRLLRVSEQHTKRATAATARGGRVGERGRP
jgi:hypothetical protein